MIRAPAILYSEKRSFFSIDFSDSNKCGAIQNVWVENFNCDAIWIRLESMRNDLNKLTINEAAVVIQFVNSFIVNLEFVFFILIQSQWKLPLALVQ